MDDCLTTAASQAQYELRPGIGELSMSSESIYCVPAARSNEVMTHDPWSCGPPLAALLISPICAWARQPRQCWIDCCGSGAGGIFDTYIRRQRLRLIGALPGEFRLLASEMTVSGGLLVNRP